MLGQWLRQFLPVAPGVLVKIRLERRTELTTAAITQLVSNYLDRQGGMGE